MIKALALPGNPSSIHAEGRRVRGLIEAARTAVGDLVGADAKQVFFTSGGSEANTTVLAPVLLIDGKPRAVDRLILGATEHPSVLSGGRFASDSVDVVPVNGDGIVGVPALREALAKASARAETVLVSVMLANNETGAIQPVPEIAQAARSFGAFVHTDAVQAAGRVPIDIDTLGVDFLTLSGHKLGAPHGSGAIIIRSERVGFLPLVTGGGQEGGRRAGTENVAAIAGFGAAARIAASDLRNTDRWRAWRDRLAAALAEITPIRLFSERVARLPQTLCFGLAAANAETLVIGLDLAGISVSSGSACSSGKVGASHVLAAMGAPPELSRGAVRVSFGWDTEEKDLDRFRSAFAEIVDRVSAATGDRAA